MERLGFEGALGCSNGIEGMVFIHESALWDGFWVGRGAVEAGAYGLDFDGYWGCWS